MSPNRSINKIGHALGVLDPVFRRHTLENEKVRQAAKDIGVHESPRVLQSMVICKQPKIGGKGLYSQLASQPAAPYLILTVPTHNDSTFLYTDPPSAVGAWIALEECTPQNGCLVSPIKVAMEDWSDG